MTLQRLFLTCKPEEFILILKRDRTRADASPFVTGRDVEKEKDLALRRSPEVGTWTLVGDSEEYRASGVAAAPGDQAGSRGGAGEVGVTVKIKRREVLKEEGTV
jgi:hypothetical protein